MSSNDVLVNTDAKVAFSGVICAVGLVGNFLVMFVVLVLREFRKSVTHWYVLQLAIADSLFLISLPFKMIEDINGYWMYPEWMCKGKETLLFLNYYTSVSFLMIMSIDRYIAVCHPFSDTLQRLRKPKSAIIITVTTWVAGLLICIPVMLYSFKVGIQPNCRCTDTFTDGTPESCHYHTRAYGFKVFNIFNFVVMFILPLAVMGACYGLIIFRLTSGPLKDKSESRSGTNKSSKSEKDRRRVTIMCLCLVGCFFVCWLPFHAVHIAKIVGISGQTDALCRILPVVASLLAYSNSALNPYLYSFLGGNFAQRWKQNAL
uniref:G-protein coupled receptors family 1 profile domain-containing protein n=1 Tax=Ciona intestinalis TaxID=7719 RepID=F6T1G9_CIOIN